MTELFFDPIILKDADGLLILGGDSDSEFFVLEVFRLNRENSGLNAFELGHCMGDC